MKLLFLITAFFTGLVLICLVYVPYCIIKWILAKNTKTYADIKRSKEDYYGR